MKFYIENHTGPLHKGGDILLTPAIIFGAGKNELGFGWGLGIAWLKWSAFFTVIHKRK